MTPARRAILVVAMALVVAGPAPGETGGCAEEAILADATVFCVEAGSWECRRREARGEDLDVQACVDALAEDCLGSAWPASCLPPPTERQAALCLDALSLVDNVEVPLLDLPECDLCQPLGGPP